MFFLSNSHKYCEAEIALRALEERYHINANNRRFDKKNSLTQVHKGCPIQRNRLQFHCYYHSVYMIVYKKVPAILSFIERILKAHVIVYSLMYTE